MKLTDLEPRFIRYEHDEGGIFWRYVELANAHGVLFLCPKCFVKNGGRVGTHSVICWSRSRGTPEEARPLPGRWKMDGTSFADLTLNGDITADGNAVSSRSVLLLGGCGWHGFVTNGEVTDA